MRAPGPVREAAEVAAELASRGLLGSEASLVLDRAWPWGPSGGSALYLPSGSPGLEEGWAVVAPGDGRLPAGLARAVQAGRAVALPWPGAAAWKVREDPRLPGLGRMLRRRSAREALRQAVPELGDPAVRLKCRVVRYKPTVRCVVRYRLRAGGRRLGSLFAKGLQGAEAGRLEGLYRRLAAASRGCPRLAIPAPLGSVLPWGALVWRRSRGVPMARSLEGEGAAAAAAAVGAALGSLHRLPVRLPRRHDRRRELATLERWEALAGRTFPALAPLLREALEELRRRAPELPVGSACPSHRDFHDGQLLARGGRVVLLDLDTAARAEPELDAGNFLAHLRLRRLGGLDLPEDELRRALLAAYLRESGRPLHPGRLGWYEASAALRLACVYLFRPGERGVLPALVEETLTAGQLAAWKREVV